MEENIYKIYVKIDSNNVITQIDSSVFISDITGWTQIDEGTGDKYAHAQGNYLDNGLIDNYGKYNYKLVGGVVIELTDSEKTTLFPTTTAIPTDVDRIQALESAVSALMEV